MKKPKIGISACLLGRNTRYDGGNRLDPYIRDVLGKKVQFVPICPEVECGLPVPRETIQLVGRKNSLRLLTTETRRDITDLMQRWCEKRVALLKRNDLSGFILKARSPSCGIEKVKVYNAAGVPRRTGIGLFARAIMEHFPDLPVIDDERMQDTAQRNRFLRRVHGGGSR